jgi:hypothetical protein
VPTIQTDFRELLDVPRIVFTPGHFYLRLES